MVFSSLNFLFIFLPVTLAVYLLVPQRLKNIVLLIASVYFYAWGEPVYVVLMLLNILFNYVAGLQFAATKNKRRRKKQLILAVLVNLLLLGFFKYAGFLVGTLNSLFGWSIVWKELSLPIGISFYTFQALSYVIDAYRGKVKVQKSFINFAVYITMFPQLIAGPIVTYSEIENQLGRRTINIAKAGAGIERLILGLAKKVILANNLGLLYTSIQASAERSVMTTWLGAVCLAMQIYFDFSGYSDMAIGMGKMLGFDFPENFNFPFMADSVTEFWRRWHMTLSGWFKDYVYFPLGGSRVSALKHIRNTLIVWFLTGLWHGASWNFVMWGLYYGVLLIIEKYIVLRVMKRLPSPVQYIYTFVVVILGFVLFGNTDFTEMGKYMANMFGGGASGFIDGAFLYYVKNNLILLILSAVSCSPIFRKLLNKISRKNSYAAIGICLVLFFICVAFLVYGSYNPFLYFRF
ncbi:MAG: MBOAT family protein [Parasporobacterium sp.]|nr:MBOAT family protein [Parasporobacterium sp.]